MQNFLCQAGWRRFYLYACENIHPNKDDNEQSQRPHPPVFRLFPSSLVKRFQEIYEWAEKGIQDQYMLLLEHRLALTLFLDLFILFVCFRIPSYFPAHLLKGQQLRLKSLNECVRLR